MASNHFKIGIFDTLNTAISDEDENIWEWDEEADPPGWVLDTPGPGSGDCYAVDRNGISQNFGDDCDAAADFAAQESEAYAEAGQTPPAAEEGVCTVDAMNNLTRVDCEANGGQWLTAEGLDSTESLNTGDINTALAGEFAKVAAELDKCFADPDIANFMGDI